MSPPPTPLPVLQPPLVTATVHLPSSCQVLRSLPATSRVILTMAHTPTPYVHSLCVEYSSPSLVPCDLEVLFRISFRRIKIKVQPTSLPARMSSPAAAFSQPVSRGTSRAPSAGPSTLWTCSGVTSARNAIVGVHGIASRTCPSSHATSIPTSPLVTATATSNKTATSKIPTTRLLPPPLQPRLL